MAAKSNQLKKAEAYAKKKAQGVRDFILPAMPGTAAEIEALARDHGFEDWREMLTVAIHNLAKGVGVEALAVPRHSYTPSEKVLKQLEKFKNEQ